MWCWQWHQTQGHVSILGGAMCHWASSTFWTLNWQSHVGLLPLPLPYHNAHDGLLVFCWNGHLESKFHLQCTFHQVPPCNSKIASPSISHCALQEGMDHWSIQCNPSISWLQPHTSEQDHWFFFCWKTTLDQMALVLGFESQCHQHWLYKHNFGFFRLGPFFSSPNQSIV